MATATNLESDSRLAAPAHVLSRQAAGETVLLSLEREEYYGLDGAGSRFWELLEAGTSLGEAISVLRNEYEVEASVLDVDLRALVAELAESGLVLVDAA